MVPSHYIGPLLSFLAFILFLLNFFSIVRFVHQPSPQFQEDIRNDNDSSGGIIYLRLPEKFWNRNTTFTADKSRLNLLKAEKVVTPAVRMADLVTPAIRNRVPIRIPEEAGVHKGKRSAKGHDGRVTPPKSPSPPSLKSPMGFESNLVEKDPPNFHVAKKQKDSKGCYIRYPSNNKITFNNLHWQVLDMVGWKMFFYSSFYDNREEDVKIPDVRIIGMSNSLQIQNQTLYCQLWFTEYNTAKVVRVSRVHILWPWKKKVSDRHILPFMLSCPLKGELESLIPFAVTIVSRKCTTAGTNKLKVINPQGPHKPPSEFGVCVKGLDFPDLDISLRLIEWIELLRLLGAAKIYPYLHAVHPNAMKVLEYYEREGVVQLGPLTIPGPYTNDPVRRHRFLTTNVVQKRYLEMIPMQDCLYRNLHFKYLAFLDIDEVIIPRKVKTWAELLKGQQENEGIIKVGNVPTTTTAAVGQTLKNIRGVSSYQAKQNGCFFHGISRPLFEGIPKSMHMLQHVYKIPSKPGSNFSVGMKGFFVPNRVLTVFNHQPSGCFNGPCRKVLLDETLVQLNHYKHVRRHCNGPKKQMANYTCTSLECLKNVVTDKIIWNYTDPLKELFEKAVSNIFKDQPPTLWTE